MIPFETAQRLIRMQERLRNATYHELKKDGHHKSSEGAMELCFHLPSVLDRSERPSWSVWAYSYLLCRDGRSKRWFGQTAEEAISKAEDEIEKWCFTSEMEEFETHVSKPEADGVGDPFGDDEIPN